MFFFHLYFLEYLNNQVPSSANNFLIEEKQSVTALLDLCNKVLDFNTQKFHKD